MSAEGIEGWTDFLLAWNVPVAKSRTKPRKGKIWESNELIPAGGHDSGRLREPRVSRVFFEADYEMGAELPRHIRCVDYEVCLNAAAAADLNSNQTWRCSGRCPGWATSVALASTLSGGTEDDEE